MKGPKSNQLSSSEVFWNGVLDFFNNSENYQDGLKPSVNPNS
jgi:hypothetical protein